MELRTIIEPSAEQRQIALYNEKMRNGSHDTLSVGRKYAVVLLKLAAAVKQPGDYAALGAAIKAIPGIADVGLAVDGQAPATIPEGKQLVLYIDAHLRIDNAPEA